MNKIFDPKITQGPWRIREEKKYSAELIAIENESCDLVCDFGDAEKYYPTQGTEPNNEDLKAILAVPEMLEVVKTAQRVSDYSRKNEDVTIELCLFLHDLAESLQKLHKKHGTDEIIHE